MTWAVAAPSAASEPLFVASSSHDDPCVQGEAKLFKDKSLRLSDI